MERTVQTNILDGIRGESSANDSQQWILVAMDKHGRGVLALLWRILGCQQDVCDAYQDTFIKLSRHQHNRPSNIKAYLFRTASNIAISYLRKRKSKTKACGQLNRITETIDHRDPSYQLETTFLRETLRNHISQLPEHLRQVITLHDLAELSYKQVAKILDISVGSVRVFRCRAVQLLAKKMSKHK